jgi:hypothetical protein
MMSSDFSMRLLRFMGNMSLSLLQFLILSECLL